ncbi:MAG: hypothetical protein RLY30_1484 [Pseudomonadota bacterium]|jgi:uncharacterized protein YbaR (Trm112 family)
MDSKVRDILACPQCHGLLTLAPGRAMLVCEAERLGYPIIDGIPHLMVTEAVPVPEYTIAPLANDD